MRLAHEVDYILWSNGLRKNYLVTIRSAGADERARKRSLSRKIGHLGQALQRRGVEHVGLTIYEREIGGQLHAHHLLYSRVTLDKILNRFADLFEPRPSNQRHDVAVHARRAVGSDIAYITKQRLPLPPGFERSVRHRRQPAEAITGVRMSLTRETKNLVTTSGVSIRST